MRNESETKRHEVARLLQAQILTGRFPPGAKLIELKLASEMGVSQASVREALQELEGLGLVVKYPNRGTFVINLVATDLVRIYQVRRELEPLACSLATAQIDHQTLQALEGCLSEMKAAAAGRDYQAYLDADFRFHAAIWQSQPNSYLTKLLKEICLPLFANDLIHHYSASSMNFERALRQHDRILKTIQTGDSGLVAKVVRRLMDRFLRQDLADLQRPTHISEEPDLIAKQPPTPSVLGFM